MSIGRESAICGADRCAAVVSCLVAFACASGGAGSKGAPPAEHPRATVDELQTPAMVISSQEATDVEELLERADLALDAERFEAAEKDYRLAHEHAVDQERRLRALLGLGTAQDLGGKPARALSAYSRYVSEAPAGRKTEAIRVRKVRLLVYLEKYEEAGRESSRMDLSEHGPVEQVALLAARALAEVFSDRLETAERFVSRGRAVVDEHSLDRVTVPPLDVAALYFALGEVYRRRAQEIRFDPVPTDFTVALERRCQLILDAQGAYSEAMRSQDAHYSSMAGVKVGRMYQDLHTELTNMPVPPAADTRERRQLFEGALRLRYSILLRKSLAMMRATASLIERSEQPSRWRKEVRDALTQIEAAGEREQAAIDALPYSREQLQQVLDEMAEKARAREKQGGS